MTSADDKADAASGEHVRELIFAHFSLRIRPAGERRMRAHLPTCAACRKLYDQHLALAALDPDAASARDRLAVGLGLRRPVAPLWTRIGFATGAVGVVALALFLVNDPRDRTVAMDESRFVARGGQVAEENGFSVFHADARNGDALAPLSEDDVVPASDELAFSYRNPAGKRYLLIFAVERAAGPSQPPEGPARIRWYHPAWEDPSSNPAAIAVPQSAAPILLPEAIAHDFESGEARLFAVFVDQPLTVRQVEAAVTHDATGNPDLDLAGVDALVLSRKLRLSRR
jgi:hypothetical protein